MHTRSRFPWWLLVVNGLFAFAVTVFTIEVWQRRAADLPAEELRMLRLVYRQVMHDYVEEPDGEHLVRAAVHGLVLGLNDGYSKFISPESVGAFDTETTGEYQGIGMMPAPRCVPITVHYLLEDGPAERAGLAVGDRIVRIGDDVLDGLTADNVGEQAPRRLRGVPGSKVTVRVRRAAGDEHDVTIERGGVQRTSVKWVRLLDAPARIGYVHIATFQQRTAVELDAALRLLEEEAGGAPLGGLVLDLRHNLGGLLDESVAIANRFLVRGTIVTMRGRGDVERGRHDVDPKKTTHPDLPMVLLVDQESASASEVLAGALQDHARATIVGVRTFGKGKVQSIYRFDDPDFRLKLTTSHYFTPSGRNIDSKATAQQGGQAKGGIAPDVEVGLPPDAGKDVHRRLAAYEVPRRYEVAAAALARELGFESEVAQLAPEEDGQLGGALAVLRERMAGHAAAGGNGSSEGK